MSYIPKKPISKIKLLDVVYAKHPKIDNEKFGDCIGHVDHVSEKSDKPFYVEFLSGDEDRFTEEELTLVDDKRAIIYLKERIFELENRNSNREGEYDCLIYEYNHLEDATMGLIKQHRKNKDLTYAINRCISYLGGKESVDEALESIYSERDYNYWFPFKRSIYWKIRVKQQG